VCYYFMVYQVVTLCRNLMLLIVWRLISEHCQGPTFYQTIWGLIYKIYKLNLTAFTCG